MNNSAGPRIINVHEAISIIGIPDMVATVQGIGQISGHDDIHEKCARNAEDVCETLNRLLKGRGRYDVIVVPADVTPIE